MGGTVGGRRKESCVKRPSGVPAPYAAGAPEASASSFREECTVAIGKRIVAVLDPVYLRIGGYRYLRGGMPIDVFWEAGTFPVGMWLPDQENLETSRRHGEPRNDFGQTVAISAQRY
jgi:hypothetical protein